MVASVVRVRHGYNLERAVRLNGQRSALLRCLAMTVDSLGSAAAALPQLQKQPKRGGEVRGTSIVHVLLLVPTV